MGLSISDHIGIAITYDHRLRQHIKRLALRMATYVDYFDIVSSIQPDIRAAVIRDFEATAEVARAHQEKEKETKGKASSWWGRKFGKRRKWRRHWAG